MPPRLSSAIAASEFTEPVKLDATAPRLQEDTRSAVGRSRRRGYRLFVGSQSCQPNREGVLDQASVRVRVLFCPSVLCAHSAASFASPMFATCQRRPGDCYCEAIRGRHERTPAAPAGVEFIDAKWRRTRRSAAQTRSASQTGIAQFTRLAKTPPGFQGDLRE